jgi:hypothetical protein
VKVLNLQGASYVRITLSERASRGERARRDYVRMHENQLDGRVSKIEGWLAYLESVYAELISRPSESPAPPGFDAGPRTRPCEHRPVWRRGRLCLACDNTGWRPIAKGEEGIDPYTTDIKTRFAVVESDSSRKARLGAYLDDRIEALRRSQRIQLGVEVPEGRDLAAVRRAEGRLGQFGRRLARELRRRPGASPLELATVIPGRIPPPPSS